MKRIFLSVLMFVATAFSFADNYKILFINTQSVTINGKKKVVGDTFKDTDKIKWDSDKQAIKVLNVTTNKICLLTSKQLGKSKTLKEFYEKTNHLSSRGGFGKAETLEGADINLMELEDESISLLDSVKIDCGCPIGEYDTVYLLLKANDEPQIFSFKDRMITLTRDMMEQTNSDEAEMSVVIQNELSSINRTVIDGIMIELIPEEIEK